MEVYRRMFQHIFITSSLLDDLMQNIGIILASQNFAADSVSGNGATEIADGVAQVISWAAVLNNIDTIVGILISIITGVSIILGMRYLKSLKEKYTVATFTFWSQINVRIVRLYSLLKGEKRFLNNMYPPAVQANWETNNLTHQRVKEYQDLVKDTLKFLESTDDQMPAYVGWSEDFKEFIQFLTDIIQYDICNNSGQFVENISGIISDRDTYWEKMCGVMERLQVGINKRQKEIEKDICKESLYKRLPKQIKYGRDSSSSEQNLDIK